MAKKIFAVIIALALVLSGCSGTAEEAAADGGINIKNERIIKEFKSTVNVFHRYSDSLLFTSEEGEMTRFHEIDAASSELRDSVLTELAGRYIYYEAVGNGGFIAVEERDYKNTLKYIDKDKGEKVIAEHIGPADAINISISPKAGKLAYTSLLEGNDIYGIYIYDMESSKNYKLTDIRSDGLIDGFNYLVNWSPDENNVIIHDKYIYDANSGSQKGEIKSAYSNWSADGSRIAFILEEEPNQWLSTTDYSVYPGKKICIYDISTGGYDEVFRIEGDEYILGEITWSGNGRLLSFAGIKLEDSSLPDWYMKLNYSSIYIIEAESKRSKRLETAVDASDGTMIELGNIKFSNQGSLLSFTVGNYEESSLYIVNTDTLEVKDYENVEYLHWIDGENYAVAAGRDSMYFCRDNSIVRIDDKLQENIIYTSQARLDDFYLSTEGKGIVIFELLEDVHTVRYIGE